MHTDQYNNRSTNNNGKAQSSTIHYRHKISIKSTVKPCAKRSDDMTLLIKGESVSVIGFFGKSVDLGGRSQWVL